ncbi:hypothetical protein G7B40_021225 [Aetokthonos hydrillicola Thurmond2011]|jgi:hypothetical protein|uniref:Uncharacterized protein n=1 Tax=Aetokthonos hydrillicola Thurmond2011 TaxID=2712845 RepID=A0AAP5I8Q1_9CYAN|nr:hypothetical protein [Aetokthonos hydrillicola]MBW4587977.1 hypothetical protein [Aetokthonos hydrillicola CCALA 1050]MDR9897068.1 hypothetical protein [Aetokthonos hydrillicola Thurmond2011]
MKGETLAELVARTIIEFERREAQLQQGSQMQPKKEKKPKRYKHSAA